MVAADSQQTVFHDTELMTSKVYLHRFKTSWSGHMTCHVQALAKLFIVYLLLGYIFIMSGIWIELDVELEWNGGIYWQIKYNWV